MKRFRYTYYLLALLCIAVSSCESIIDAPETEEKAQINLAMNLSGTGSNSAGSQYTYAEERYIHDVAVYIFNKDNRLIEKVKNPLLSGKDGDATRNIYGTLQADYSSYTSGVNIVVLTNLEARNVIAPTPAVGTSKADLYASLSFDYVPGNGWKFQNNPKQYIPMFGEGSIDTTITTGINDGGSISLYRAIARIDVIINGGEGFKHFSPSTVKITRYNTKGSCATENLVTPNIPKDVIIRQGATFFQPDATSQIYRLYIPEYKNNNASDSNISKVELTGYLITGNGTKVQRTYTMEFQKTGENLKDILRNNLYRFNITGIANEITVTSSLDYKVEKWQYIEVHVPSFN